MSGYSLTARARLDVQQIWNYIAEDNINAADFWAVYSYLIAYLPDTKPIQIVRVVHGARDIKALFEDI